MTDVTTSTKNTARAEISLLVVGGATMGNFYASAISNFARGQTGVAIASAAVVITWIVVSIVIARRVLRKIP